MHVAYWVKDNMEYTQHKSTRYLLVIYNYKPVKPAHVWIATSNT